MVPFLGMPHLLSAELSSIVGGRIARWASAGLSVEALRAAMANEVGIWIRAGYTAALVSRFWKPFVRKHATWVPIWAELWRQAEAQAFSLESLASWADPWPPCW